MAEKKPITEAQKKARRVNGSKSRGPKTEAGKATSRQNAIRHGGYARVIDVIAVGPMAEVPERVVAFYEMVMNDLDPGGLCVVAAPGSAGREGIVATVENATVRGGRIQRPGNWADWD